MKIILKTGQLCSVDMDKSTDEYYVTSDGYVYTDTQIDRIVDDCRTDYGVCNACHSIIKLSDIEQHFAEQEQKRCSIDCPYSKTIIINTETTAEATEVKSDPIIGHILVKTAVTKETSQLRCEYIPQSGTPFVDCIYGLCRKTGITPYSADNVLRLRYPLHVPHFGTIDTLMQQGFELRYTHDKRRRHATYKLNDTWELLAIIEATGPTCTVNGTVQYKRLQKHNGHIPEILMHAYTNCIDDMDKPVVAFALHRIGQNIPVDDANIIIPETITGTFFIHSCNDGWRIHEHIPELFDDRLEQTLLQLISNIAPDAFNNTGVFDTQMYHMFLDSYKEV